MQSADQHTKSDVIILARGGGSLEDLWSFNDETVARAIYRCRKPIVSGVGHETDFTIADFVADVRAPTPSAAAELVSPNQDDVRRALTALNQRAVYTLQRHLHHKQQQLRVLHARLKHPRDRLEELQQTADRLELRLNHALQTLLHQRQFHLHTLRSRLLRQHPQHRLSASRLKTETLQQRLISITRRHLDQRQAKLQSLAQQAHLVSPLATLDRGYSLTTRADTGVIIRTNQSLSVGDTIVTRLSEGEIISTVSAVP
ncbi:MAG: exodeoxyribonuclease VII large subunit [Gammaproteobacteria bacterium]